MREVGTFERYAGLQHETDSLEAWQASLIVVAGGPEGHELPLDRPRLVVGRGPGADLDFADDAMSQEHAALEFIAGRFHITDLGSVTGTQVNGVTTDQRELCHGDRIGVGDVVVQILIQKREVPTRSYVAQGT